jgi:hypothetical protein
MKRSLIPLAVLAVALITGGAALAQSGHFITSGANAPQCFDIGTQVQCTGNDTACRGRTVGKANGPVRPLCAKASVARAAVAGEARRGDCAAMQSLTPALQRRLGVSVVCVWPP